MRETPEGRDIGNEYALHCVGSWRASGFVPVSINAVDEDISEVIGGSGITSIRIDRDGRGECGKPVPYLCDFLETICKHARGPIAITNADIELQLQPADYALLTDLKPGWGFVSRRYDIDSLSTQQATAYSNGYDFFAFHSEDLKVLRPRSFALGMPWWDHYLPLAMIMRGLRCVALRTPFVFHLRHTDRWNQLQWARIGEHFVDEMERTAVTAADMARVRLYRVSVQSAQHAARRSVSEWRANQRRFASYVEPTAETLQLQNDSARLGAIATTNVQLIDQWCRG